MSYFKPVPLNVYRVNGRETVVLCRNMHPAGGKLFNRVVAAPVPEL